MKGLKLYLVGSAVVMLLYLIAQYYKPKPTDWRPTYLKEDKIPFGTYILYHELESLFPKALISSSNLPVYNTLKDKNFEHTNYLMIAGEVKMDEYDYAELVKFMEKGNHVFIAAYKLSDLLSDTLNLRMNSVPNYGDIKGTPINFVSPVLKEKHYYIFNKGLGDQYFSRVDTLRAAALGRNDAGEVNFVKYNFGKGALYMLPSPQLLSNYNLLNPAGATYIAKVLSHLPTAERVIWDENNTKGNVNEDSVLRVLFKHEQLRWAYYLALTGLLIFILFEMKRRQRIIPVIEPLKNTSVDFVKVVGKVYYQQRDNRDIVQKKISYFLEYVRTSYRLKTSKLDKEFMADLVLKSGVNETVVEQLIDMINKVNNAVMINDNQLIDLNKLIEKFYKQAQ
ncbi:MAG: DUF4350 domain-containing protein [Candidatus Pedobacter colombiensis]|uniref:DUF4350 domain-containing protein n=1 Tax=Candidatus Pedobacter colombiensis TaxID=3121371 RepID=A0AAJ5W6W0_9SPHI|nr:DUF4350 domain-containing protein [Pedobacter sp.]WEK19089.1 MAG: DUF4350 domain-containing protein [Pedobacter sp.]